MILMASTVSGKERDIPGMGEGIQRVVHCSNMRCCAVVLHVFLPKPPAKENCAGPFPNVAIRTGRYSRLQKGFQVVIPAMNFTGCGQTLRWHVGGKHKYSSNWWRISRRKTFTLKLWRPTPSGGYTEVKPDQSFTSSVRLMSLSAEVDYQVAFSPGDIPGLSVASISFSLEYTSNSNRETGWYYWLITTSISPTILNPKRYASTVALQLPLLSIEGRWCNKTTVHTETHKITPLL